jgi:aconitate decarboxylase
MSLPNTRTARLASWSATLTYSDIPDPAIQRTKDLFLDWLGCTIAGRSHPAVAAIVKFVKAMGPTSGKSELVDGELGFSTSAAFAALVNAAASHVVEQDDLHNGSITHPVCNCAALCTIES